MGICSCIIFGGIISIVITTKHIITNGLSHTITIIVNKTKSKSETDYSMLVVEPGFFFVIRVDLIRVKSGWWALSFDKKKSGRNSIYIWDNTKLLNPPENSSTETFYWYEKVGQIIWQFGRKSACRTILRSCFTSKFWTNPVSSGYSGMFIVEYSHILNLKTWNALKSQNLFVQLIGITPYAWVHEIQMKCMKRTHFRRNLEASNLEYYY